MTEISGLGCCDVDRFNAKSVKLIDGKRRLIEPSWVSVDINLTYVIINVTYVIINVKTLTINILTSTSFARSHLTIVSDCCSYWVYLLSTKSVNDASKHVYVFRTKSGNDVGKHVYVFRC